MDLKNVLSDYSRYFIGESFANEFAEGLFDLERSFAAKRDHSLNRANGRTFGSGV